MTFAARPTFKLLGRFALAEAPCGIAIDPARGRLWVTLIARDELVELVTAVRRYACWPGLAVSPTRSRSIRAAVACSRPMPGREPCS